VEPYAGVPVEIGVRADDRNPLDECLRGELSVERVAVLAERQCGNGTPP